MKTERLFCSRMQFLVFLPSMFYVNHLHRVREWTKNTVNPGSLFSRLCTESWATHLQQPTTPTPIQRETFCQPQPPSYLKSSTWEEDWFVWSCILTSVTSPWCSRGTTEWICTQLVRKSRPLGKKKFFKSAKKIINTNTKVSCMQYSRSWISSVVVFLETLLPFRDKSLLFEMCWLKKNVSAKLLCHILHKTQTLRQSVTCESCIIPK